MAKQWIEITKISAKHKDKSKDYKNLNIIAINKNSIGTMYLDGVAHSYNMHLLPTNTIDFDKINVPKISKTKTLTITRK